MKNIIEQVEEIIISGKQILQDNPQFREIWANQMNNQTIDDLNSLYRKYNIEPRVYDNRLLFSTCIDGVQLCVWSTPVKANLSYSPLNPS